MKHIFLSLLLVLSIVSTSFAAQGYYEFSPKLTEAYEKAISLQFGSASRLVADVKREEPNNVLVYYVENYIDFLKIYIDEDYTEFKKLEPNKEYRLKKLKEGNEDSPYYLYTQAEIRLQWAVARAKFNEVKTAMFEVRKAFKLLERNDNKFPDFIANKKSLGILHSVVGAVPPNYQWAVKLAGMSGTIEQGRREIKEVVDYANRHPEFIFDDETVIMYSLLILHIGNQSTESWNIISSASLDASKNPLISFAQASVAQHTGRNDEAIRILENKPTGSQYHPFHFMDYMLGLSKLYRQDRDAGFYLNKYVMNFNGRNYIKECYQRIAWFELLKGNHTGYKKNMTKVLTKGKTDIDGDKNALKEAKSSIMPNANLLKARLLFDGGLLIKANQVLSPLSDNSFNTPAEKLEFQYRKGRILQELKKHEQAITAYNTTIGIGEDSGYYFACRAALEAGTIKENLREYSAARIYYNKCLDMSPDQYKTGLHSKAKAGLNRIRKM
jgi:tetratricopeptide (TPR) repeat protein